MLVRTAGRRQRRQTARIISTSFASLNLPWLAPAQLRWSASSNTAGASAPARSRRHDAARSHLAPAQVRQLATVSEPFDAPLAERLSSPIYHPLSQTTDQQTDSSWDQRSRSQVGRHDFAGLRSENGLVIINNSMQRPEPLLRVQHGIHGTVADLIQHLHTSLRVNRLPRAETIIRRLAEQCAPTSPEIVYAHRAYLEETLRQILHQDEGSPEANSTLQHMQRWFELEIRGKGVVPDSAMVVLMIRASFRALNGTRRDRCVRRYAEVAKSISEDVFDDVLGSEDYSDHEFMMIGRATSEFIAIPEEDSSIDQTAQVSQSAPTEETQTLSQTTNPLSTSDGQDLPEVVPTMQRGGGLQGIKRNVQALRDLPSLPPDAPPELRHQRELERQRNMEETSIDVALDRWRQDDEELRKLGINMAMQTKSMGALMWQWHQALLPALKNELAEVRRATAVPKAYEADRNHYGPYLELLPLEKLATITILMTMLKIMSPTDRKIEEHTQDVKLYSLTISIGNAIEQECQVEASKSRAQNRKFDTPKQRRFRFLASRRTKTPSPRVDANAQNSGSRQDEHAQDWPLTVRVKLGAMLISKLIETAQLPVTRTHPRTKEKITQMQPAFLHRTKYHMGKKYGMINPNPVLAEKIESEPVRALVAKRMPMVVEPKPWTGWQEGGYLHYSPPIMRLAAGDKSGKDYFLAALDQGGLDQVMHGLNCLSKVPWKVNSDVFKVQLEAWNSGKEIANFAPLHPALDMPPEPSSSLDPIARRRWLTDVRDIENKRRGLHSKRCFQNFQLEVARAVIDETLYFPHNMDFRGRAYPIPPYLNHMGADNVRALLTFAEGKKLGETGLRWLKIHLATVAGHDKASLEERVEFTMKHLDDIYDTVRDPLGGRRWWLQFEDAWQTLAACFELTKALDSPDPTEFVSYLPIHQDGTCNGLQHYAALGGDEIGARQVNLEPGDRPADVYTAVAEAVKESVRHDAEQGLAVAQKLHGHITRKCVKQPVMTNVYGVTFFGARAQVRKQLQTIFPDVGRYDAENLGTMSHYVAKKIFESLGTMFGGAQAIQAWLGQCADRISTCLTPEQVEELIKPTEIEPKAAEKKTPRRRARSKAAELSDSKTEGKSTPVKPLFRSTVVWTTPLGLPVVQPYRKSKLRQIKTNMQILAFQDQQVWDPVSRRKQLQAFPPNFIHSLDATHMLLSAVKCTEIGMTFASIHDSFWTHASDVGTLSSVLRDAFVDMHSDDVINRLREELLARHKGCMYLASVNAKSDAGLRISAWRKESRASSTVGMKELALEYERNRLLQSLDENERQRGEAMVTPASILAAEGDAEIDAIQATDNTSHRLGSIPREAELHEDIDSAITETPGAEDDAKALDDDMRVPETDKISSPKPIAAGHRLYVWMPMQFPPVPAKGKFDVTRLRASKYFFH